MIEENDPLDQLANDYLDRIESAERDGMRPVLAIALVIQEVGNDPLLADSVIRRCAKAADKKADRLLALCKTLARFTLSRDRGQVRSSAAYLGSSLKRLAISWGVDWNAGESHRC